MAGEPRAEDRRVDDAVGGHQGPAEAPVVALDLADRRDQLPAQVARGVGLAHHGLGPLVGRQGAARHRLHRGGSPGVDQDAEAGRVAARVLGHRRRCLDRAGELGHVGDDGVGGGSRREGEHRTSRRARVGAHQPGGGDHRQRRQDRDQAESTEGGTPPQTSARSCHRSPPKSTCPRQPPSLPNTVPLTSCPITRSLLLVLSIRHGPERHCDRIVTPYDARPALEDSSPTPSGLVV